MDEYLIIEAISPEKAEEKERDIHIARVEKYRNEGYYIEEKSNGDFWIYPKNALTGETDMSATPTKLWAPVMETPDGTAELPVAPDVEIPTDNEYESTWVIRPRPMEWTQGYSEGQFNSQFDSEEFEV